MTVDHKPRLNESLAHFMARTTRITIQGTTTPIPETHRWEAYATGRSIEQILANHQPPEDDGS